MSIDIEQKIKIIEKTVQKVISGIKTGEWRFTVKLEDNIGMGDIDETYLREGKAIYQDHQVVFRIESTRSLLSDLNNKSYLWYFFSNLKKTNPDEPFIFEDRLDEIEIKYGLCDPNSKRILDLVKESLDVLEKAQTDFHLDDIDI